MEQFDCNGNNLGVQWTEWQQRLEQLFIGSEIKTRERRLALMFFIGGCELKRIHDTLPDAEEPVNDPVTTYTEYDKAVLRLNAYFIKRNTVVEQYMFSEAVQKSDETIANVRDASTDLRQVL